MTPDHQPTLLKSVEECVWDAMIGESLALADSNWREAKLNRKDMAHFRRDLPRIEGFWERFRDPMRETRISRESCHGAVVEGWLKAARMFLADGVLDESERFALKAADKEFELDTSDERLAEARDLLRLAAINTHALLGRPEEIDTVPFDVISAPGERIFWTSPSTLARHAVVRAGHYAGLSARVSPGLYVRAGGFQSQPEITPNFQPVAHGAVAMSNLRTWFLGDQGVSRIPHGSLISTQPFIDGFSLTDGSGAPVFFSIQERKEFPGVLGGLLATLARSFAAS